MLAFALNQCHLVDRLLGLGHQSGDLKHLACAFAVTCSDDWCVNVLEAAILEELVGGESQVVSDAHNSRDQFCAAAQVGLLAKELLCVALDRQGVLRGIGRTCDSDFVDVLGADLELEWLTVLGTHDKLASDNVSRADLSLRDLIIVWNVTRDDNLQRVLAATIVELNEEEVLTTSTSCACPTTDLDQMIQVGLVVFPETCDAHSVAIGEQRLLPGAESRVAIKVALQGAIVARVDEGLFGCLSLHLGSSRATFRCLSGLLGGSLSCGSLIIGFNHVSTCEVTYANR